MIWATRTLYHPGDRYPLHGHDYCECTWISSGTIALTDDTGSIDLRPGNMVFIHQDYQHGLLTPRLGACVLVNVAVPTKTVEQLAERYASWRWGTAQRPLITQVSSHAITTLDAWPDIIQNAAGDSLIRDACLLDLQRHARQHSSSRWANLPGWLSDALITFSHPPHLAQGIPALARLSGHSREHCSRIVRQYCGCTLRSLVNDLRLDFFEEQLRRDHRPITALAQACWGKDVSHLYRLFSARHGTSPAVWRRRLHELTEPGSAIC